MRARLHPLRQDLGIEQEAHFLLILTPSLVRVALTLVPRSGEAAKKSARLPERRVLRSHSAVETTTATGRPCRVMACGPSLCARVTSSLSFAFAAATVQSAMMISFVLSL
jgi:hypothetical protein